MTTKAKNKVSKKARKRLALNKETLRDLSAGGKAKAVRGGAANTGVGSCDVCHTGPRQC